MTNETASQFGHFLDYSYWQDAIELLEFQINRRSKDEHKHYNTLSMYYYDKLGDSRKQVATCDYFTERVASGLLYGLEEEFFVIPYVTPKSGGFGLRNYKFLSYPMRVLYYAAGLYLLRLSQEFVTEYIRKQRRINARYGGNLYYKNDELKISKKNTYYMSYYKQFRNQIRKEVNTKKERTVIIKLDIENYYDNISVPLLTELLDRYLKQSVKESMNFTRYTIEQLRFLFSFVSTGQKGIPQFGNDIISGFIGYLYLTFADLRIDHAIQSDSSGVVESNRIIRYMDDIYISITFCEDASKSESEGFLGRLFCEISDILYNQLALRINPKATFYRLEEEDQRTELLDRLRKTSPGYYVKDDDGGTPEDKIETIFTEIEQLRSLGVESFFQKADDLQEEILKEVYDRRVDQLLRRRDYRENVDILFEGLNYGLIRRSPKEIIVLLLKSEKAQEEFKRFLLDLPSVTISDADMILIYLAQIGFEDCDLTDLFSRNIHMKDIVKVLRHAEIDLDSSGYFDLSAKGLSTVAGIADAMDQIRLRRYYEAIELYSLALNHLVNELQSICRWLDNSDSEDGHSYGASAVVSFLESVGLDHDSRIMVRNLFDRRNINPVSHPSSHGGGPVGVSREDYERYRGAVAIAVRIALTRYSDI